MTDRPSHGPADQPTDGNDGHMKVTLPIKNWCSDGQSGNAALEAEKFVATWFD